MNVTLKLSDDLCRAARHRAIDEAQSLSSWVAGLIERELAGPGGTAEPPLPSWMEALTLGGIPDWFYDREIPAEDRRAGKIRDFSFEE